MHLAKPVDRLHCQIQRQTWREGLWQLQLFEGLPVSRWLTPRSFASSLKDKRLLPYKSSGVQGCISKAGSALSEKAWNGVAHSKVLAGRTNHGKRHRISEVVCHLDPSSGESRSSSPLSADLSSRRRVVGLFTASCGTFNLGTGRPTFSTSWRGSRQLTASRTPPRTMFLRSNSLPPPHINCPHRRSSTRVPGRPRISCELHPTGGTSTCRCQVHR